MGVLVSAALSGSGCSDGNGDDPKECTVKAAFELTVRTVSGALPGDTTLEVKYGGGVEAYRVDQGMQNQEVVLCTTDTADASDAGQAANEVYCKLWTQGAAAVTVTATGYPTVKQDLEAKAQGKCIQTVPVEIVLGDQDAGI